MTLTTIPIAIFAGMKKPAKIGGFQWSHGESNPDLLNAIQPSSR